MNVTALPTSCLDELPIALFKSKPEDFQVDELLGFEPDGDGEHLWINVRKRNQNTRDMIELLAKAFSIPEKDVGYSGLKDKHALTTQWVSLPMGGGGVAGVGAGVGLSGEDTDLSARVVDALASLQDVEVVTVTRSRKKLRTGAHRQNRFKIVLRNLPADHAVVEQSLALVRDYGFPNYFGSQRFGHGGRNVASARSMFIGNRKTTRFKRGIYLSAARSYLFNLVLAKRVASSNWKTVLAGEACILDGTNSSFHCEAPDDDIYSRNAQFDIHTSGPLHGRGRSVVSGIVKELERECLKDEESLFQGLEKAGLKQERRALRAVAYDLQWQWLDNQTLEINVVLQKGVYATSLLRELVRVEEVATFINENNKEESP